jgi:hypothetical protein
MKILNHINIYNLVFSSVSNCCICCPCCMTNNVEMAALHFNLNYICNKFFLCCLLNPINIKKTTKLNPNTPWMKQNYKKTIKINYYCFLPFMNHSRFMKIQYICQLFCPTCFFGLSILIFDIPYHLQSSCIYTTNGLNQLL